MTGAEPIYTEISLLTYGVIALAAFVGAVLASMSGTGSSLLLAPVLVPVFGVKALLPIIAVGSLFGNIARAWVYREWIDRKTCLKISIFCVPGVIFGVLIYDWLDQRTLLAVIGAFMILSVPVRRWSDHLEIKPSNRGMIGGSLGYGVIAGALPSGGVVLVAMLLGFGLRGGAVLGTDSVISIVTNLARVGGFGSVDLLNEQYLILGLLIGAANIPAALVARFLVTRMGLKLHTVLLDGIVTLTGIYFIYQAVRAWLYPAT
ncbi:MAG: hypothetical protein CMM48_05665 [Rhodospirillaceae bacterium]|nr:hypothetical protein [Rhodospirillaceae bacterium]HAA91136.1 hypothetical protein [Rhodospirillaceae bacterium]